MPRPKATKSHTPSKSPFAALTDNPIKTAVALVVTLGTLLGALPAWWAVEDHFWLRREAQKQQEGFSGDLADVKAHMEANRLWAEYGRLDQTRQRLEKAVRDAGFRQQLGGRLAPAEQFSLQADQADLATVNAQMVEVKRAINALHTGK